MLHSRDKIVALTLIGLLLSVYDASAVLVGQVVLKRTNGQGVSHYAVIELDEHLRPNDPREQANHAQAQDLIQAALDATADGQPSFKIEVEGSLEHSQLPAQIRHLSTDVRNSGAQEPDERDFARAVASYPPAMRSFLKDNFDNLKCYMNAPWSEYQLLIELAACSDACESIDLRHPFTTTIGLMSTLYQIVLLQGSGNECTTRYCQSVLEEIFKLPLTMEQFYVMTQKFFDSVRRRLQLLQTLGHKNQALEAAIAEYDGCFAKKDAPKVDNKNPFFKALYVQAQRSLEGMRRPGSFDSRLFLKPYSINKLAADLVDIKQKTSFDLFDIELLSRLLGEPKDFRVVAIGASHFENIRSILEQAGYEIVDIAGALRVFAGHKPLQAKDFSRIKFYGALQHIEQDAYSPQADIDVLKLVDRIRQLIEQTHKPLILSDLTSIQGALKNIMRRGTTVQEYDTAQEVLLEIDRLITDVIFEHRWQTVMPDQTVTRRVDFSGAASKEWARLLWV